MFIDGVNVSPLLKAFSKFESFRINQHTEQEKTGTIQAFEYCFELIWKIMKRLFAWQDLKALFMIQSFGLIF